MRKALKDKRQAVCVCIFMIIFALGFTAAAVWFLMKDMYAQMLLFALFSAICSYVFIAFVYRYADARTATELIDIIDCYGIGAGPMMITELSETMGWKPSSTRKFIANCRKRGYFY